MFAWTSVATLMPLIIGVLLLLIWATYSYGICKSPMIPLIVLADRTAAISYFGTILQGIIVSLPISSTTFLPLTFPPVLRPPLLPPPLLPNRQRLLPSHIRPCHPSPMPSLGPHNRHNQHRHRPHPHHKTFLPHRLAPLRLRHRNPQPPEHLHHNLGLDRS